MPPESEQTPPHNPFDYRRPIQSSAQFSGQLQFEHMVGAALDRLVAGKPEHVFLTGPRRIGKTSALNFTACAANERGLISIHFPLAEALLDSSENFFQGLYRTAVEQLSVATGAGEAYEPPGSTPAELLMAFEKLGTAADSQGHQGFVVLIDRAELLNDDDDLLQTLATAFERLTRWMFVVAGYPSFLDEISEVYPPLLGKARRVVLRPYRTPLHVLLFFLDQLASAGHENLKLEQSAIEEFYRASGGHPQLLTMLAHHAWEEATDKAEPSLSSTAVKMTVRELARLGDPAITESSVDLTARLDMLGRLTNPELELTALLAYFEELSLGEFATALCLRDGCPLSELSDHRAERLGELEPILGALENDGILTQVDGRVDLRGKALARAFVSVLARERGVAPRTQLGSHPTYATYVAYELMQRLREALPAVAADHPELAGAISVGSASSEERTADTRLFVNAAEHQDLVELTKLRFFLALNLPSAHNPPTEQDGLIFLGISLRVGFGDSVDFETEEAHVGALWWATEAMSPGDLTAVLAAWRDAVEPLLAKVNVRLTDVCGASFDPDFAFQYLSTIQPAVVRSRVYDAFAAGRPSDGIRAIETALPAVQRALEMERSPFPFSEVADLFSKLGFLRALTGEVEGAAEAIRQAELASAGIYQSPTEKFLLVYNAAYLRAHKGEYAAAARLLRQEEASAGDFARCHLLLFFPSVVGWSPPAATWNTASVPATDVPHVLATQALTYDALAGQFSHMEFRREVDNLPDAARRAPVVRRLLGWVELGKFHDAAAATTHFAAAAAAEDAPPVCTAELDFATKFAN